MTQLILEESPPTTAMATEISTKSLEVAHPFEVEDYESFTEYTEYSEGFVELNDVVGHSIQGDASESYIEITERTMDDDGSLEDPAFGAANDSQSSGWNSSDDGNGGGGTTSMKELQMSSNDESFLLNLPRPERRLSNLSTDDFNVSGLTELGFDDSTGEELSDDDFDEVTVEDFIESLDQGWQSMVSPAGSRASIKSLGNLQSPIIVPESPAEKSASSLPSAVSPRKRKNISKAKSKTVRPNNFQSITNLALIEEGNESMRLSSHHASKHTKDSTSTRSNKQKQRIALATTSETAEHDLGASIPSFGSIGSAPLSTSDRPDVAPDIVPESPQKDPVPASPAPTTFAAEASPWKHTKTPSRSSHTIQPIARCSTPMEKSQRSRRSSLHSRRGTTCSQGRKVLRFSELLQRYHNPPPSIPTKITTFLVDEK